MSGSGDGGSNPEPAAAESPPTDAGSGGSPEAGSEDRTHVVIEGLEKQYGDVTAVEKLSLSLAKGELLVLVGPSGCGKSTTLRCIAGLEEPSAGDIRIRGESVVGKRPEDRSIAMVFQNYALYPHKTARENIGFGLRMTTDLSKADINDRVESVAEMLGIEDLLEQQPKSLSGGQQQRVALGRAIVRDPAAFLLDEPLSNLDATLRSRMRTEIQELQQDLDATTIYVTHDQTEAMTLGDRVAVLNAGRLQQVDAPQQLYDFPQNRFVAEFIGDPAMNMLPVTIEEASAVHDAFEIPLPEYDGPGGSALLGIRPEDLEYVDGKSNRPTIEAEVTVTEPLGDTLLLYCRAGGEEFKMQSDPRRAVGSGDRITLTYDPKRLHVFDPESGDAVYHSADSEVPQRLRAT